MLERLSIRVVLAAGLVIGIGVGVARADVVAPPDDGVCPHGTEPGASHGLDPAYCTVLTCSSDADCSNGLVCAEQPLCHEGGWAHASCPDGTCSGSFPCEKLKVCVEPSVSNGCAGCSVEDGGLWGLSALVLLVFGFALRRRQSI